MIKVGFNTTCTTSTEVSLMSSYEQNTEMQVAAGTLECNCTKNATKNTPQGFVNHLNSMDRVHVKTYYSKKLEQVQGQVFGNPEDQLV